MRRALFALLLSCAVVAVVAAPTGARSSSSFTPRHGTYMGSDHHGHTVTFTYAGEKIVHFTVGHTTSFPEAKVQGHQVHHTCGGHPQHCIRGSWTDRTTFKGYWNNPNHGGDMEFVALQFAT